MTTTEPLGEPNEAAWRALLGRKISVRYRVHDDPAHPFSEAIGMVQKVADGRVEVVNRRGEVARFAFEDLVAGKVWL